MEYTTCETGIFIKKNKEFDLKQTLECGQCFRFVSNPDGSYTGVARGKLLNIFEDERGIMLKDVSETDFNDIWYDYFDMGLDYCDVKKDLFNNYNGLADVIEFSPGIRILKQDAWEALCSFIISQNNNIPRIMGIVDRLCRLCGKEISDNVYDFPAPESIASMSIDDLAPLRSGFRAKYILDAAQKVASGEVDLDEVKKMDIQNARDELMKITGVGPKVAECTLLYGMYRLEAFPIDVWMKRAMQTMFEGVSPSVFGKYAGIAQQYIFHYTRQTS